MAVSIADGVADALPLADGSVDAGVASFVLCTVPDQARAGGAPPRDPPRRRAPFLRARRLGSPCARAVERALDATIWPRVGGGCHLARDTQAAIERAGFEIASCERFAFGPGGGPIRIAHILGVAKRP